MKLQKPHVTLKLAMSVNGYIDNVSPFRFSNEADRRAVQKIRGDVDAILIGSNTLNNDNPSLLINSRSIVAARLKKGMTAQPLRIILCGARPININSNLLTDGLADTVVFMPEMSSSSDFKKEFVSVKTYPKKTIGLEELCDNIFQLGVRRLLVEGGANIAQQFLDSSLIDRVRIAYAPIIINNPNATKIFPVSDGGIKNFHCSLEDLGTMYAQNFYLK